MLAQPFKTGGNLDLSQLKKQEAQSTTEFLELGKTRWNELILDTDCDTKNQCKPWLIIMKLYDDLKEETDSRQGERITTMEEEWDDVSKTVEINVALKAECNKEDNSIINLTEALRGLVPREEQM